MKFKNGKELEFHDILSLEDKQIYEVLDLVAKHTIKQLRDYESKGLDLSYLTAAQKNTVIVSKNRVVFGRSPDELRRQKKVLVTLHSQERILERIGSNELATILDIIQRIIDTNIVLKAQFKGYSSLSYTLTKSGDQAYKLPISFKWVKGKRQILSVTVTHRDAHPSEMTHKIVHNYELSKRMIEFKKNLVKRNQKN